MNVGEPVPTEETAKPDRQKIVVSVIELGSFSFGDGTVRLQLEKILDTDGVTKLFIPFLSSLSEVDPNKAAKREEEFSSVQRNRLWMAMDEHKLPLLVAVHEVLNKGAIIEQWNSQGHGDNKIIPRLIPFIGPSNAGKSSLLATLALTKGVPVFDIDTPSGKKISDYVARLTSLGLTPTSPVREIYRVISQQRKKHETGKVSANKVLDSLSRVFAYGYRPNLILIDTPGVNYLKRPFHNILDEMSLYGFGPRFNFWDAERPTLEEEIEHFIRNFPSREFTERLKETDKLNAQIIARLRI